MTSHVTDDNLPIMRVIGRSRATLRCSTCGGQVVSAEEQPNEDEFVYVRCANDQAGEPWGFWLDIRRHRELPMGSD